MSYSKRTCHSCGYRDIQPNMVQVEIEYVSGTSNTGITKRTVVGSVLGSKNSSRQLGKWLLSPNKRVYKRRRKVWKCHSCAGVNTKKSSTAIDNVPTDKVGFYTLLVIVGVVLAFIF